MVTVGGALTALGFSTQAEQTLSLRFADSLQDSSPHQHPVVISGDPVFVPGPVGFGQAARFVNPAPGPGITPQFIEFGPSPIFQVSPAMTIAFWVKPDPPGPRDREVLLSNGPEDGSDHGWRVFRQVDTSSLEYSMRGLNGAAGGGLGPAFADGVWLHIAMVWQASEVRSYQQGKRLGTASGISLLPREYQWLRIGGVPGQDLGFNGCLDEIQVFDHALSDDEVAALALALNWHAAQGRLILKWSTKLPPVSLQVRRGSTAGPGEWIQVPDKPVFKDGVWQVEVGPAGEPAFYRLKMD